MKIALALCLMAAPAFAAGQKCGEHDALAAALKKQFGEVQVMLAAIGDGTKIIEIFANAKTGTWTAIITEPNGIACIPAAGQRFAYVPPGDPA